MVAHIIIINVQFPANFESKLQDKNDLIILAGNTTLINNSDSPFC